MMRSMYSAVSGLKTHQTRMDVLGNNIANVNTVAFKSSSVTFSDILYQTTSNASGANAAMGTGGVNAKQIGLGVSAAATNVSITTAGASETTGNPFDIRLTDSNSTNFFIVNNGTENLFTRAGSFYVDGAGNLCMSSTGYTVMGWQVDETTGDTRQDTVSALRIMQERNLTSAPEATTMASAAGVIDKNDTDVTSTNGKVLNLSFFDNLGYSYTAKFAVKDTDDAGRYTVELSDVLNSDGVSIISSLNATELSELVTFGDQVNSDTTTLYTLDTSKYTYDATANTYNRIYSTGAQDSLENVASDFATNRINGFSYTFSSFASPTIATTGTLTLSTDELQASPYNFTLGTDTTGTYFYKNGVRFDVSDFATSPNDFLAAIPVDVTNVTNPTINYDASAGTLTITVDQNFTGVDGLTVNATTNNFEMPISDMEAIYGITPTEGATYTYDVAPNGNAQIREQLTTVANTLLFNPDDGTFVSINGGDAVTLNFNASFVNRNGETISLNNFQDISIDFTQTKNLNNSGTSTIGVDPGATDGTTGKGRKLGAMTGVTIDNAGKIYGTYDNGNTELLGQIAVAQFANASGLSKVGDSCYTTTLNSGDFDGVGVDITADGSSMTTGELEMSNVDLSTEFTQMITTQRGFQANSRVITTSDTLLEELVNLKR